MLDLQTHDIQLHRHTEQESETRLRYGFLHHLSLGRPWSGPELGMLGAQMVYAEPFPGAAGQGGRGPWEQAGAYGLVGGRLS